MDDSQTTNPITPNPPPKLSPMQWGILGLLVLAFAGTLFYKSGTYQKISQQHTSPIFNATPVVSTTPTNTTKQITATTPSLKIKTNIQSTDGQKIKGTLTVSNSSSFGMDNLYFAFDLKSTQTSSNSSQTFRGKPLVTVKSDPMVYKESPDNFSIKGNEVKEFPFEISYSPHIASGKYTLIASIVPKLGRPITTYPQTIDLTGSGNMLAINSDSCRIIVTPDKYSPAGGYLPYEGPIVYKGATAEGTCEFTNPTDKQITTTYNLTYAVLHVFYYPQSQKQTLTNTQTITFNPKETKKLSFNLLTNLPPQVYDSTLVLVDQQGNSLTPLFAFRWTIPGESARVDSIVLDKDYYAKNDIAKVSTTVDPSMDLFWRNLGARNGDPSIGTLLNSPTMEITVTNSNKQLCGQKNYSIPAPFYGTTHIETGIAIQKDCPNPHATATLLDNNKQLATGSTAILSSEASLRGNLFTYKLLGFGIGILILTILILLIRRRGASKNILPSTLLIVTLFGMFMFFFHNRAEALLQANPPGNVDNWVNYGGGSPEAFTSFDGSFNNSSGSGWASGVFWFDGCANFSGSVAVFDPYGHVSFTGQNPGSDLSWSATLSISSSSPATTNPFTIKTHLGHTTDVDCWSDQSCNQGGAQEGIIPVNWTPPCNSGVSCSGSCTAPANTCSTNNGTKGSCNYTTFSGGGSCTETSALDQSCTLNNCSNGYVCSSGSCVLACQNSTPSSPSLSSPSNGLSVDASSETLSWSAPSSWGTVCSGSANDQYQVHFGTSSTPPIVATDPSSTTSYTASSLAEGITYYWDVCVSNNGFSTQTCSSIYSFTTTTLTANLTANGQTSISQAYPFDGVTLSASAGGTSTGTMNYTFYCNRSDTGTNITSPYDAKFDGVSDNPKTVNNLCNYNSAGIYYAKVIVERGSWAAQSQVVITLTNTSPTVSGLTVDPPSSALFCGASSEHFSWTFSDAQDGTTQTAYQLQVDNDSNFSSPEFDSGVTTSSSQGRFVPVSSSPSAGQLGFNTHYYWRVQVFDKDNASSGWVSGSAFNTPAHPWPQAAFTWSPTVPDVGDKVTFTDQTIFASGSVNHSWQWTIPNALYVDSTSSTSENPHVQFNTNGLNPVTLQSTDDAGTCSASSTITSHPPLPQFREIQP